MSRRGELTLAPLAIAIIIAFLPAVAAGQIRVTMASEIAVELTPDITMGAVAKIAGPPPIASPRARSIVLRTGLLGREQDDQRPR